MLCSLSALLNTSCCSYTCRVVHHKHLATLSTLIDTHTHSLSLSLARVHHGLQGLPLSMICQPWDDTLQLQAHDTVPDNPSPPVCWWVGKTNWHKTNLIVRSRRPERVQKRFLFIFTGTFRGPPDSHQLPTGNEKTCPSIKIFMLNLIFYSIM